jgi:peptide/nickel transport system permease protein
MFQYLLKRILLFIPTLIVVSWLAFGLSKLAPGDPVLSFLVNDPFGSISTPGDLTNAENACRQAARTLNLDKPAFYFSITPKAFPDTLYRIPVRFRRQTLHQLTAQYGNWPQIEGYFNGIRGLEMKLLALPGNVRNGSPSFKQSLRDLYVLHEDGAIGNRLRDMAGVLEKDSLLAAALAPRFSTLQNKYLAVKAAATPGLLKIPAFRWHGFRNQYHIWFTRFLRGDFGISAYERMPAATKVKPALFWTLTINLAAIILAFGVAIPIGVVSAARRGGRFDRTMSLGLFMLYSLPAFWVGTMLLIFFTTREYGMDFFAGPGLGQVPASAAWWQKIWLASPHLLLPVLCIAYPALAFIARQMRGSMTEALQQDFVRTARAKGLPESTVIWRHAFRNALFPVITLIASVFPAAIAGSVAIEYIFNIPGMGWLMLNAILQKDWSIVFTVLMLGAVLTMVGMLVADVLYALADPRVRFSRR